MIWFALAGTFGHSRLVLMLKPSARDSRLARLRMDAIKSRAASRQIIWKPIAPNWDLRQCECHQLHPGAR